ncbi:MAG: type III-B CRISPR module-associated protein Cmr5 [Sulfuricella sp.]
MRARSQEYAETIYDLVDGITALERKQQKRYGSLCHGFPLIVRENGLAAAFGFLAAKGNSDTNSPESCLLRHYAHVLRAAGADALRQAVIAADLAEYRRLTREALSAAEWFKRYAEAVLKVDTTGAGEEDEEAGHD